MYKVVPTDKSAVLDNGVEFEPVLTLADEYGGRAQISVDDHCYVLRTLREGNRYYPVYWWFREAVEALALYLPTNPNDAKPIFLKEAQSGGESQAELVFVRKDSESSRLVSFRRSGHGEPSDNYGALVMIERQALDAGMAFDGNSVVLRVTPFTHVSYATTESPAPDSKTIPEGTVPVWFYEDKAEDQGLPFALHLVQRALKYWFARYKIRIEFT